MFGLRSLFAKRTPLDRAEAEAARQLQCQRVHTIREAKRQATVNGLLASVDDEARARYLSRVEAVLRERGSA